LLLFEVDLLVLELEVYEVWLGLSDWVASGITVVFAKVIFVVVAAELALSDAAAAEDEVAALVSVGDVDVVEAVGGTALKLYVAYVATLASPP